MKHFLLLSALCFSAVVSFGQSQTEMNLSADKDLRKADRELNDTYQKVLSEYKSDTAFIRNLRAAQKIWIKLRDAEMRAMYPEREPLHYGSVFPMCWSMYETELTKERTKKLQLWLTGIEEGDVCSGSVKIKQ